MVGRGPDRMNVKLSTFMQSKVRRKYYLQLNYRGG